MKLLKIFSYVVVLIVCIMGAFFCGRNTVSPTKEELFHFNNMEILKCAVAKYDAKDGMYIIMDAKTHEIADTGFINSYKDHKIHSHNLRKLITLIAGLNSGVFSIDDIVFNDDDVEYINKVSKQDKERVYNVLEFDNAKASTWLLAYLNVVNNEGNLLTEEQSVAIRKALRENVVSGPAKKTNVADAEVTGLGSTTQKQENENDVITMFVGTFKSKGKEYGIMTIMDSPHGIKETWNYNSAGWNAVPLARDLIKNYILE